MIEPVECSTWANFKAILSSLIYRNEPASRHMYLFRGHGSAEWELAPSFDRVFIEFQGGVRDKLEDELVANFKRLCEGDARYRELLEDDVSTLALAQHYGLPTRLLDWTESPYVAAFFAFQGHFQDAMFGREMGDTVAIWVLDPQSYIWSPRRGVQLISPAAWDNERLQKQAGWFTLSRTSSKTLVDYFKSFPDAGDALRQITLPATEAQYAIPDLDLMGINHGSMFPELEGRARSAVTRTLLSFRKNAVALLPPATP